MALMSKWGEKMRVMFKRVAEFWPWVARRVFHFPSTVTAVENLWGFYPILGKCPFVFEMSYYCVHKGDRDEELWKYRSEDGARPFISPRFDRRVPNHHCSMSSALPEFDSVSASLPWVIRVVSKLQTNRRDQWRPQFKLKKKNPCCKISRFALQNSAVNVIHMLSTLPLSYCHLENQNLQADFIHIAYFHDTSAYWCHK